MGKSPLEVQGATLRVGSRPQTVTASYGKLKECTIRPNRFPPSPKYHVYFHRKTEKKPNKTHIIMRGPVGGACLVWCYLKGGSGSIVTLPPLFWCNKLLLFYPSLLIPSRIPSQVEHNFHLVPYPLQCSASYTVDPKPQALGPTALARKSIPDPCTLKPNFQAPPPLYHCPSTSCSFSPFTSPFNCLAAFVHSDSCPCFYSTPPPAPPPVPTPPLCLFSSSRQFQTSKLLSLISCLLQTSKSLSLRS